MGLLQGFADIRETHTSAQAERALSAMVLKQMLEASGAFRGTDAAGSSLRSGLFVEALADAVSQQLSVMPAHPSESQPVAHVPPTAARPTAEGAPVITSGFGQRLDPLTHQPQWHGGVDLRAAEGSTVVAVAAGTVHRVGPRGGYGNAVEIDHGDGRSTLYAHGSEILVTEGQRIEAGQPIMHAGHTGHATAAHLHLEVREGGVPVNPDRALKFYAARAETQSKEPVLP